MSEKKDQEALANRLKDELEAEGEDIKHLWEKTNLAIRAMARRIASILARTFDKLWFALIALADIGEEKSTKVDETKKISPNVENNREEHGANNSDRNFKISIAHPKLLSKRFESVFVIQLFFEEARRHALKNLRKEFREQELTEHLFDGSIRIGRKINVKVSSPDFVFSDPVTKMVDKAYNKLTFLGKPKDNCEDGFHRVLITISDEEQNLEIESFTIQVHVVDFAFDHVSRPLLSKTLSAILGLSSLTMFTLTFLEQIDKTFGYTSGTAVGVLATFIYINFFSLYKHIRTNNP